MNKKNIVAIIYLVMLNIGLVMTIFADVACFKSLPFFTASIFRMVLFATILFVSSLIIISVVGIDFLLVIKKLTVTETLFRKKETKRT